jgi:integrase/recombinase XerD
MTRLRKMMLEELERRNYSEATTRCYIRTVEDFSRRFKRSPDGLGPEHIREYQAELFKKRKLSPGTVTQRLAALRFFYIKTLKKTWSIAETPYPKKSISPSFDPQPGRSHATHQRSSNSFSSHSVDDPLRHRSTTR